MKVGWLVTNAKNSSGLTVRQLAADADVAGSTITRIQSGVVDPSVPTLERILDAAGFELQIGVVRHGTPRRPHLGDLVNAWSHHRDRVRLDWTRWRTFLDELALHPDWIPQAIYVAPPPASDRVIDALVAAVAEKLADDARLPRPAWTERVASLAEPYRPPVARTISDRTFPEQFIARGLMIDTERLWRRPETVGV